MEKVVEEVHMLRLGGLTFQTPTYLHFIPYTSNGITSVGTKLLMDSVESYVYSVLGAQGKTRCSIVSDQLGKSLQTQEAFRRIVGDTIVQSNVNVTISNMRTAIRDTNVVLNMAINPNVILIPSKLIILEKPIPGYNNILSSPTKATTFGLNTKLNYVGVKQVSPPKKQLESSSPTNHLDTLGDSTHKIPTHVKAKSNPPVNTGDAAFAGFGLGSIIIYILFRIIL
jgi:hypothetical protein